MGPVHRLRDDRDRLQAALRAAGIPTAVHYPLPLHRQPAYAAYGGADPLARSVAASHRVLSLPMSADLGAPDQTRIARALEGAAPRQAGQKHASV